MANAVKKIIYNFFSGNAMLVIQNFILIRK